MIYSGAIWCRCARSLRLALLMPTHPMFFLQWARVLPKCPFRLTSPLMCFLVVSILLFLHKTTFSEKWFIWSVEERGSKFDRSWNKSPIISLVFCLISEGFVMMSPFNAFEFFVEFNHFNGCQQFVSNKTMYQSMPNPCKVVLKIFLHSSMQSTHWLWLWCWRLLHVHWDQHHWSNIGYGCLLSCTSVGGMLEKGIVVATLLGRGHWGG